MRLQHVTDKQTIETNQIHHENKQSPEQKQNHKDKHTPMEAKKPTFVTRYCPNAHKTFKILLKHWTSVHDSTDSPILKRFLRCTPRLAHKANPNLARRLVRAKLRTFRTNRPITAGADTPQTTIKATYITQVTNFKHSMVASTQPPNGGSNMTLCQNSKCPLHTRLINSTQIRSRISRRTFIAHDRATCDTPYIVYLIQCRRCGRQYMGQTRKLLKARYATLLRNIKYTDSEGALQDHFRKDVCGNIDNITMQLLHRLTPWSHETQAQIEETLE